MYAAVVARRSASMSGCAGVAIALMGIPLTGDKCSLLAPDRLNEKI